MAQQLSLLLSLLLVTAICVSAMYPITARFGAVNKLVKSDFEVELPPEFVTYYYNQTLDHFNYKPESYRTFQQRYIMNSAYWGGANSSSPIFVYTGDEASITAVADFAGFIVELASRFNGLLLYIEVSISSIWAQIKKKMKINARKLWEFFCEVQPPFSPSTSKHF